MVVSEALLYVYHRNKQNGNFEKFASFKPHDSAVSGVCFVKSDVWLDPEEVETNFSAHKTCGYSFQTCAYDGTIGKWYMQDIIDGKFQSKENSNITKEPGKWDSTIMSYHTAAVKCLHLWGECSAVMYAMQAVVMPRCFYAAAALLLLLCCC